MQHERRQSRADHSGASGGNGQTNASAQGSSQGTQTGGDKSSTDTSKSAGGSSSSTKKATSGGSRNESGGDDSGGDGGSSDTSSNGGSSNTSSDTGGSTTTSRTSTSTSAGGKTGVGGTSSSTTSRGGQSNVGGTGTTAVGGTGTTAVGGTGTTAVGGTGTTAVGGTSASSTTSTNSNLAKSQCSGKPGPSYDQFFNNSKLATIRITIDSANLGGKSAFDALWGKWKHCPPFNYVPATLEYESPDGAGNVICENVGIRARGSRRATGTQGLKLDMQVLDTSSSTHRRFADLNRINFLSNEGDNSLMIQCLAYKALREVGIPAPRCNHIKVYLNDQLYGVLQNVEQPNKGFCRRHFGSNQGFLFAASPSQDCPAPNGFADSMAKLVYSGDSFSSYTSQYMLDSATSADGEKTLIPMLKCGDATATPDDSTFKTCIAEWLDVTEWLRVIAAESLMPEMQSWIGYYRNYYLYFSPDSSAPHGGKFAVWTWDLDSVYQKSSCSPTSCDPFSAVDSLYGPLNTRAKLVKRLTTVFKSEYCTVLKDFLSKGFKPSLVDDMAKVIESSVGGSSVSTTAWQSEVSTIRNYFTTHASQMQTTVNSACQ